MNPLLHLAQELAVADQADLARIRRMTEAEFAILLAHHAAAQADIESTIQDIRRRGCAD